jgi:hypothetical protein
VNRWNCLTFTLFRSRDKKAKPGMNRLRIYYLHVADLWAYSYFFRDFALVAFWLGLICGLFVLLA